MDDDEADTADYATSLTAKIVNRDLSKEIFEHCCQKMHSAETGKWN
ncbi:hypothetical protein ACSGGA_24820 [Salmonella enterica]